MYCVCVCVCVCVCDGPKSELHVLCVCVCLPGAVQSGIFGGREAKPHSRPYMASLQIPTHSTPPEHHTCGGVLIREDYVLTAAHCLK